MDILKTFTHRGITFDLCTEPDIDSTPPWQRADGHGVVTDWVTRDKAPSERVLSQDRNSRRFYDMAETMKIAKRDGWNVSDEQAKGATKGERIAMAVERDFEFLRSWCADEWHYVGVIVRVHGASEYQTSLWGIEDNATDYIENDVAIQLADQLISELPAMLDKDAGKIEAIRILVEQAEKDGTK